MIKKIIKCSQCGAVLGPGEGNCNYCGTVFSQSKEKKKTKISLKEFGWENLLIPNIIGIIFIYLLGWFYEDINYWLDNMAILIWAVILPLWILSLTSIWIRKKGQYLIGILVSILIFISHFSIIMYFRKWHFNDDYLGIAAMFSGIVLLAWIAGRITHYFIRLYISKY